MALSTIDYEKVDASFLQTLQMIKMIEDFVAANNVSLVEGTPEFISALDNYRNAIGIAMEQQGKR